MRPRPEDLCLDCGLCCNGVIFADGQLQPADDSQRLRALGLKLKRGQNPKFAQPCGAWVGCKCGIYAERPDYCRQFECALLRKVASGEVPRERALRLVKAVQKRVKEIERLLSELGDDDLHLPLATRFRRTSRKVHEGVIDDRIAASFGELTMAVHQLNVSLSENFYPG